MPLKEILMAMEESAEAEINRIAEQANVTIVQIRTEAEKEAHAIRERHRREILIPLQYERARQLNRARLAALRTTSRAREKLFADALECARTRLANMRVDPRYATVLGALVAEALAQIDGEVLIRADPRDEKFLREICPDARVQFDLQTWGGIEARTTDGSIVVINTLEARLEQAHELLRQKVMPLFELPISD